MKVVQNDTVTIVYPFARPDAEPDTIRERIVIYPDRSIKVVLGQPLMDAERVRLLVRALLHAAGIAEKGRE